MLTITLAPRVCPVCATRDSSRLYAESNAHFEALDEFAFASRKLPEFMHLRLAECHACDLLYADPAPALEELAALYRDADFASSAEARLASQTYGRILQRIIPSLPDQIGAADIGTGDGTFLSELIAAGFRDVVGIEPSSAPIAAADPAIRPLIRHDIFRPDSFPDGSLSLVTCFQTIEHLADPLAFCRDAWRALKPGGCLFLIGHNRRALSAQILGRKSPIFDIEHLQLFSPQSFRNLMKTAGFAGVQVQTIQNRYPIRYWTQLLPVPQVLKPRLLTLLDRTRVGRWVVPMPAGNLAAFAFKNAS